MKKTPLLIAVIAVLLAGVFGVDYWLRANKKFVGGEVVDSSTSTASKPVATVASAPETIESLEKKIPTTKDPAERAKMIIQLDDLLQPSLTLGQKPNASHFGRRRILLEDVVSNHPEQTQAWEAASRLLIISLFENDEAKASVAVDAALAAIARFGISDSVVTPYRVQSNIQALADIGRLEEDPKLGFDERRDSLTGVRKTLARKFQDAIEKPDEFGPPAVREANRFKLAAKLITDPLKPGDTIDQIVRYVRKNVTSKPISEDVEWILPAGSAWQIQPARGHVSLAAGEEKVLEFRVIFDHTKGDPAPFPAIKSTIVREGEKNHEQTERLPVETKGWRFTRVGKAVRVAKAPRLDGKLDDDAWKNCKPLAPFVDHKGYSPAEIETLVRLCYDDKGLYIGVQCNEPDLTSVICARTDRDSDVCLDDSVEVFFNPKPEQGDYFQVIANAKSVQYDGIGWDRSYNFKWTSAADVNDKGWALEFFLPWNEFAIDETPKPGDWILANFVRNRIRGLNRGLTQWSPTYMFHNHRRGYLSTIEFE